MTSIGNFSGLRLVPNGYPPFIDGMSPSIARPNLEYWAFVKFGVIMKYSHRTVDDKKPFVKKAIPVLLILFAAGGVWVWLVNLV